MISEALSGSIDPACGLMGRGSMYGSSTLTRESQQHYLVVSRSDFLVGYRRSPTIRPVVNMTASFLYSRVEVLGQTFHFSILR